MGGGQNYYDFNVQRQSDTDLAGRHNITGDANVETTVRFAQYLDSIGQHGNTSPELYQQVSKRHQPASGNRSGDRTASADLLSRVQDNRQKPSTPETGSPMTFPQMLLSVMTPQEATGVAKIASAARSATSSIWRATTPPTGFASRASGGRAGLPTEPMRSSTT